MYAGYTGRERERYIYIYIYVSQELVYEEDLGAMWGYRRAYREHIGVMWGYILVSRT